MVGFHCVRRTLSLGVGEILVIHFDGKLRAETAVGSGIRIATGHGNIEGLSSACSNAHAVTFEGGSTVAATKGYLESWSGSDIANGKSTIDYSWGADFNLLYAHSFAIAVGHGHSKDGADVVEFEGATVAIGSHGSVDHLLSFTIRAIGLFFGIGNTDIICTGAGTVVDPAGGIDGFVTCA